MHARPGVSPKWRRPPWRGRNARWTYWRSNRSPRVGEGGFNEKIERVFHRDLRPMVSAPMGYSNIFRICTRSLGHCQTMTRTAVTLMVARSILFPSNPAPSTSRHAELEIDRSAWPSKSGDGAAEALSDDARQIECWFSHILAVPLTSTIQKTCKKRGKSVVKGGLGTAARTVELLVLERFTRAVHQGSAIPSQNES